MFVAMLVTWAVAASIPALAPLFRGSSEPLGLILGAAAIFVVGIIDDFRDMSAPAKVAGEVLAATILYFLGVTWFQFKVPLAGLVQLRLPRHHIHRASLQRPIEAHTQR